VSSTSKWVALVVVCLASVAALAQQSDQRLAARVLGPEWKKTARTAGMVFSGTVIEVESSPARDQALPTIRLKFRVDRAIAGVEPGQVLTIREWAGAWSMHRPMRAGDHVLLLLYPLSRLGLTSPVGGLQGQVALDASGSRVVAPKSRETRGNPRAENISALQLERAIRRAREE
jgi:hypothetical protein